MEEVLAKAIEVSRDKTAQGQVATYIPELNKANPERLGVSVLPVPVDGSPAVIPKSDSAFIVFQRSSVWRCVQFPVEAGKGGQQGLHGRGRGGGTVLLCQDALHEGYG